MNIEEYKQLQDKLEKLEPYDHSNDTFKGPVERMRLYLEDNNIQHENFTKNGIQMIDVYQQGEKLFTFTNGKYPSNAFVGLRISDNKVWTDYYLGITDVPSPKTRVFQENEKQEAFEFVSQQDFNVVVKPKNLLNSSGVTLDVNQDNFEKSWDICIEAQKKYRPNQRDVNHKNEVMIQEQIDGIELRINVVEGKVANALVKMPWVIVGDGKKSIEELIEDRNNEFKHHPIFTKIQFSVSDDLIDNLRNSNKEVESVLEKDELVMISKVPLYKFGGRVYNVRDLLHPNVLELARDAVKATPGLHTAGIDLFIENLDSSTGTIIEINKNPGTSSSLYPLNGERFDFFKEFMDTYLVEQKLLKENVTSHKDLTNEEVDILIQRHRYLYEKDKMNSKVISHFHKKYIED